MPELPPGSTPRRYIPEGGLRKHNERIHRESKYVDDNKNLPFSFCKPPKGKRSADFKCAECDRTFSASVNTIMYVCPDCKKLTKVVRIDDDELACLDDRSEQI